LSAGVVAARLTAQLLSGAPACDPVTVARRLLAVQGQDQRGARLAIRARSTCVSAADVDRALTDDRSLLITWLNRGTLHLVASEDYAWLHALMAPPLFSACARRLAQNGVTPAAAERAVAAIERALASEGPLDRLQLRERIDKQGVRTDGQALVHLAKWSGLPLRDVRAGLAAIAPQLRERSDGLLELERGVEAAPLPPPRLLGAFDPVLLGWRSRAASLDEHAPVIVTVNGLFRPFALVRARAVATWSFARAEVTLKPFAPISRSDERALRADAEKVVRYLASGARVR
jgi:hypothetical protein